MIDGRHATCTADLSRYQTGITRLGLCLKWNRARQVGAAEQVAKDVGYSVIYEKTWPSSLRSNAPQAETQN